MRFFLVIIAIGWLAASDGQAGPFFTRKANLPAPDRAEALIQTLRTARIAGQRTNAARQLGEFNAQLHPAAVTALINALLSDSNTRVRRAAMYSLKDMRPTSERVSQALQQASSRDPSRWLRVQAQSARMKYGVSRLFTSDVREQPSMRRHTGPGPVSSAPLPKSHAATKRMPKPVALPRITSRRESSRALPMPKEKPSVLAEPRRLGGESLPLTPIPLPAVDKRPEKPAGILAAPR